MCVFHFRPKEHFSPRYLVFSYMSDGVLFILYGQLDVVNFLELLITLDSEVLIAMFHLWHQLFILVRLSLIKIWSSREKI